MFKSKLNIKKLDVLSLILIIITFTIDRFSKSYVIDIIQSTGSEIFVSNFLNLTLNWNTGIAFGLLSVNANLLYHSISALILLIIIYLIYLMVISEKIAKISISLIIGGALGNLYDRINYYAVPDFIDLHYKNFHWFTFNFADIFITFGVIILVLNEIFIGKNDFKNS